MVRSHLFAHLCQQLLFVTKRCQKVSVNGIDIFPFGKADCGMARKLRVEYPGAIYHVLNRGDRRETIFQDEADRQRFLDTLGEACLKTGWQVHAYCLMSNHFHQLRLANARRSHQRQQAPTVPWQALTQLPHFLGAPDQVRRCRRQVR